MASISFPSSVLFLISTLAIAVSTTAAPQISREQGNSFARKVDEINQNATAKLATPKRTLITEPELNSYLAFNIKDKIPRGLTEPHIRFLSDRQLAGRVLVDMDDFKRGRSSGGMLDPLSYISGQVPVTARGVLSTRDGKAQFQLTAAEMNGYPLPKPLVQELVRYFSRTPNNPNGFNIDEPFNLPAKIRDITVSTAEALVVQ
jgi:hypothetical protein